MIVGNETLRIEIRNSMEAGEATERFAMLAMRVARGYFASRQMSEVQRQDCLGRFCMRFVRGWHRMTEENPFAYLTGMARFAALDVLTSENRQMEIRNELS